MQIDIIRTLDGLETLKGVCVIIDVFRAGNTILSLLDSGAPGVFLVADLDQSRAMKAGHPDWILMGERGGLPPEGFDAGNSPCQARELGGGRQVILTTSAGTQAAYRLQGARAVFYGTFCGASSLVEALLSMAPDAVHLLPMGYAAVEPADEDNLLASYLEARLRGRKPAFDPILGRLLSCSGADRLRRLNQLDDLAFCTALDSHDIVPQVFYGGPAPEARIWKP